MGNEYKVIVEKGELMASVIPAFKEFVGPTTWKKWRFLRRVEKNHGKVVEATALLPVLSTRHEYYSF